MDTPSGSVATLTRWTSVTRSYYGPKNDSLPFARRDERNTAAIRSDASFFWSMARRQRAFAIRVNS
jgi:hypothetical protein